MPDHPMRILVIYYHPTNGPEMRSAIKDHLRVMEYSDVPHVITYFNAYDDAPFWNTRSTPRPDPPPTLRGESYDVVLIHYTFLSGCIIGKAFYRWKRLYDWIKRLDSLRIALPQDEGNCAEVLEEWLIDMNVHVVLSVHYRPDGPLYPALRHMARIERCLPGYINEEKAQAISRDLKPIVDRRIDIVYRARRLPHWFGRAGRAKYGIADVVQERAARLGLATDISTDDGDMILGSRWLEFIASSRATIGTEGGYSAIDWRGEVRERIRRIVAADADISFDAVDEQMPAGWDKYNLFTITPRHFEAVITKTAQILLVGDYRGIIRADEHYVPLNADLSNVDAALERLSDRQTLQEMADRAYADVYEGGQYSYVAFARVIEDIIHEEGRGACGRAASMNHDESRTCNEIIERAIVAERHRNELRELEQMEFVEKGLQTMIKTQQQEILEQGKQAMAERVTAPLAAQLEHLTALAHSQTTDIAAKTEAMRHEYRRFCKFLILGVAACGAMSTAALIGVVILLLRGA